MQQIFDYLESLIIGQGREAGQKLQLYPWQKRFLRGAFGQPDDAALSLARGGGKTTFTVGIAAATVGNGPRVQEGLHRRTGRPKRSLLMRAAMSDARVQTDPAGNAKLAKGGQGRRTRC